MITIKKLLVNKINLIDIKKLTPIFVCFAENILHYCRVMVVFV